MTIDKLTSVSIIVLNWNGWEDTVECLESLYQIDYSNYDVILVDNGSEDDSIEKIKKYCEGEITVNSSFFEYNSNNKPIQTFRVTREELDSFEFKGVPEEFLNLSSKKKLIIIENEENFGFAEGNNVGIRFILNNLESDYILLLNNDTVVRKGFLNELVRVIESNTRIGLVGPKTYYYDYNGRKDVINFAGGRFNIWKGQAYHIGFNEIDEGQHNDIKEVGYVEGSCLLAKKDLFKEVGLLDSRFFGFWEENDLCVRANKAGYACVYVPNAEIWHKVSAGFSSGLKVYYLARNRFWLMKKNSNKLQFIVFLVYFFGFHFWVNIILYSNDFTHLIKGIKDGLIK